MRLLGVAIVVLLAGCSDPPASDPDQGETSSATSTSGSEATPRVVTMPAMVPIEWDGRTKEGAWVCSDQTGASQCSAGQQVMPDGEHVTSVDYQGNLTGVFLNMTWQA